MGINIEKTAGLVIGSSGGAAVKHLFKIDTNTYAWVKDYDYAYGNGRSNYRFVNHVTKEQRPLTEAQYDDTNYTINTGE